MEMPEWLNPNNWNPETKAAAREVVKVAIVFVVTLVASNQSGKQITDSLMRKLP